MKTDRKNRKTKQKKKLEIQKHEASDICEYGCTYQEHFDSLVRIIKNFCGEDCEMSAEEAYSFIFNFDEDPLIGEDEKTCYVQSSNKEPPRLHAAGQDITEKPAGPRTNKPNPIILAISPDSEGYAHTRRYVLFRNDWKEKLHKAQQAQFAIMSPLAYYGNKNTLSKSGMAYGIAIDLDGVTKETLQAFMGPAIYTDYTYPLPNIISTSGNNVHLWYSFARPVNLTANMRKFLSWLKLNISAICWNRFTSKNAKIQFGSINQGMRLFESPSKIKGINTKCFAVNTKYKWELFGSHSLFSFINDYSEEIASKHMEKPPLPEIAGIDNYGKPRVTWEQAKEFWPEWAEEVEKAKKEGRPRQIKGWKASKNLYNSWLEKIRSSPYVGVRYRRCWGAAVMAAKCRIPFEELKFDIEKIQPYFDLVGQPEYPFTVKDMEDALQGYYDPQAVKYTYRLLCGYAGIPYKVAPKKPTPYKDAYYATKEMEALRKGEEYIKEKFTPRQAFELFAKEKGQLTLKKLRESDPDYYKNNRNNHYTREQDVKDWIASHPYGTRSQCMKELGVCWTTAEKYFKGSGQEELADVVQKYRRENPSGRIADCIRATGLTRNTVKKYWFPASGTLPENNS